jgi:hypothetical protein
VTYSLQLGDDSFILTPPTSQAEGRVKVVNQGRDNAKDYLWATLANALGQKYTINCGLLLSV